MAELSMPSPPYCEESALLHSIQILAPFQMILIEKQQMPKGGWFLP